MRKEILLASLLLVGACKPKEETCHPKVATISESIYASGIIKSKNQYEVFPKVNGIIEHLFVHAGDMVHKGTPLFSLVNETQKISTANAALIAAYNSKLESKSKLDEAFQWLRVSKNKFNIDSLNWVRESSLYTQNVISKAELEQAQLKYENSNYTYLSAKVKYDDLSRQLSLNASQSENNLQISTLLANDFCVKSEIQGRVYSIAKSSGEMVTVQSPVAIVGDADQFYLEMQVDQSDIMKIRLGMRVIVSMDSYKGQVFEAKISKIVPYMNERSRTFQIEAEFINPPKSLYPNTTFEANIVLQTKANALMIPRNFLVNEQYVYTESKEKINVKTGLKDYRYVEILEGITSKSTILKLEE